MISFDLEPGAVVLLLVLSMSASSFSTSICFKVPIRAWEVDGGTREPDVALMTVLGLWVRADIADDEDEGITCSEIGVGNWLFVLLMDEDEDLTGGGERCVFDANGRAWVSERDVLEREEREIICICDVERRDGVFELIADRREDLDREGMMLLAKVRLEKACNLEPFGTGRCAEDDIGGTFSSTTFEFVFGVSLGVKAEVLTEDCGTGIPGLLRTLGNRAKEARLVEMLVRG